eukprot:337189_1
MSTRFQVTIHIICALFASYDAQAPCDFTPPQNLTEYNTYTSVLKLPYNSDGNPPNDLVNYLGYKSQVAGVNDNGTIYLIGGMYQQSVNNTVISNGPVKWWNRINVYDSYISYDDTVVFEDNFTTIQSDPNGWFGSLWLNPWFVMPQLTQPWNRFAPTYTPGNSGTGGFLCKAQCSTHLDNRLYIINPIVISQALGAQANWAVMIIFDMNDTNPRYLNETEFTSVPANNYWKENGNGTGPYNQMQIIGDGCTTHNTTHIFHFNYAAPFNVDHDDNYHSTTYAYHPPTDQWTVLSGNPERKFLFTCSGDVSGAYIYLFIGINKDQYGGIDFSTDRYNTRTDTWTRLPYTADYPEAYGRKDALSVLDRSTNSVLITSGFIDGTKCGSHCIVGPAKVEIFRLESETWFVPEDPKNEVYLKHFLEYPAMVMVNGFTPKGQTSNASADVVFVFGGGYYDWENSIQMLTILREVEYYPNGIVRIEGHQPEDEVIESSAFDPWQRFELSFRIVITNGINYTIDDAWDYSWTIGGQSIDQINTEYNIQILTRPACQCWGKKLYRGSDTKVWCENMADNVQQVTIVELMIPSHRTLHNGYCVDRDSPWIFSYEKNTNITITATNGTYTHSKEFEFEFTKIQLITPEQSATAGVYRGCRVTNASSGVLTNFNIGCDGYTCAKCPRDQGIGRDSKGGRQKSYLQNEIEYNILMNDVLLAPGGYVRQDFEEYNVTGTESLNTDSLIALIRVRTAIATWYQECFYNFSYSWTKDWGTVTSILE